MTYANGDVYEGDWVNNFKNGKGKMTYVNGDVYEGDWMHGQKSGKGKMTYKNGNVYEGEWIGDQSSGNGIITHKDGNSRLIESRKGNPLFEWDYEETKSKYLKYKLKYLKLMKKI